MKNKRIIVSNSSGKKDMPTQQSGKSKLGFKRLLTDAGCSQKAASELLKWYTNSK
jgi:hypothetical protein